MVISCARSITPTASAQSRQRPRRRRVARSGARPSAGEAVAVADATCAVRCRPRAGRPASDNRGVDTARTGVHHEQFDAPRHRSPTADDQPVRAVAVQDVSLVAVEDPSAAVAARARVHIEEASGSGFRRAPRRGRSPAMIREGSHSARCSSRAHGIGRRQHHRGQVRLEHERAPERLHHEHDFHRAAAQAAVGFREGQAQQAQLGVALPLLTALAERARRVATCAARNE